MHTAHPVPGLLFYGEWKSSKQARILPRHKNDGLEIVLLSKGEVTWAIEDRVAPLKANTFFYTLPWQEHGGATDVQPNCEISYLCLRLAENYGQPRRRFGFHRTLGFSPAEQAALSSAFTRHPTQAIAGDDASVRLLFHLFDLLRGRSRWRGMLARDTMKLLIGSLASLAATRRRSPPRFSEAERRVREFLAMLAPRAAEPWTLETMSAACRLGRTQFAGLMKKRTGDTPMIHLNRVRIQEAQQLLSSSERSITEIALAVGFNSSQYFATVFKTFTDLDPRSYRANARRA
jgi:AraC family L-rhamnose operon regulatory protein RhaS